jgi:PAS domain S-box-containing protein
MRKSGSVEQVTPPHGEEIYRLVVESAPNAMVMVDQKGRINLVNKQTEALFGYSREELVGQPVEILLPASARARHEEHRASFSKAPSQRAMGAGRDLFGVRKDGVQVPLEIGLNPIRTAQGEFILASIVDISERKALQAQAARVEDLYRLVVESAPSAMIMADSKGLITLFNKQAEQLFRYAREEIIGQPIEKLLPPSLRKRHESYRRSYHEDPQTRRMGAGRDLFGMRKDGKEVPVEIGLNPIRTDEGDFVLASIVDISERKDLQAKIERTEALAAVGSMAAVLAHEIRNPLGSVVMAAKALVRGDLEEQDRKTASEILHLESQRLSRVLQDFLQYARPREPARQICDLNDLALEILRALKADDGLLTTVQIVEELDASLAPFAFDPDQVRQVVWNLLLNAVEAMERKGTLTVATEARDGKAIFSVTDSGPGIKPDVLEKVFDPFFTTKSQGTGLGLATTKRIIEAHGGRITAENVSGAGACFRIVLPIKS